MLPTPIIPSSQQRPIRFFTQDVIPYLHIIVFQYTNTLPFETEPTLLKQKLSIQTKLILKEHTDLLILLSIQNNRHYSITKTFQTIFVTFSM